MERACDSCYSTCLLFSCSPVTRRLLRARRRGRAAAERGHRAGAAGREPEAVRAPVQQRQPPLRRLQLRVGNNNQQLTVVIVSLRVQCTQNQIREKQNSYLYQPVPTINLRRG